MAGLAIATRAEQAAILRRGLAVIINHVDAPDPRMVAILYGFDYDEGLWGARYLGTMPSRSACAGYTPTPLALFGMRLELDATGDRYCCIRVDENRATYLDGVARPWQDHSRIEWHQVRSRSIADRARRALNTMAVGARER